MTKDKKTEVASMPDHPDLAKLVENGIPLAIAVFDRAVSTALDGTPETAFYWPGDKYKPAKRAQMWYTPHGVICHQAGLKAFQLTIVPLSHIAYAKVL